MLNCLSLCGVTRFKPSLVLEFSVGKHLGNCGAQLPYRTSQENFISKRRPFGPYGITALELLGDRQVTRKNVLGIFCEKNRQKCEIEKLMPRSSVQITNPDGKLSGPAPWTEHRMSSVALQCVPWAVCWSE